MHYQDQFSDRNGYNSRQAMNDGNVSFTHLDTVYSNLVSPSMSIPTRTATTSNRHTSNYNNTSNGLNTNKYHSTPYRSNADENEIYRSNNSTRISGRAHSYNDLVDEQNQPYRSQGTLYNSTTLTGINTTNSYGQDRMRHDTYDHDLVVKSTDLSAPIEQEMLELVRLAFRKFDLNSQRELAGFLKRSADKRFSACWHCIVGRQFSSYVTHEMNGFIYLTKGSLSILLFKSGS